jgi:hypothetical protein
MWIPLVVAPIGAMFVAGFALQGLRDTIQAQRDSIRLRKSARREAISKVRGQLRDKDRRIFEKAGYLRPVEHSERH